MTDELTAESVAGVPAAVVLARLGSSEGGLSAAQAAERLVRFGPNSLRTHRVRAWTVLRRQLNNAVLALLAVTAGVSFFLGDSTQAIIIGVILAVSVGLGFSNEYRAERAAAALHDRVRHYAVVRRDGHAVKVDVNQLVPGDVIELALGELVPADVRLLTANGLECNESILTGESTPVEKSADRASPDAAADAADLAFMGTVVSAGSATAVVYATGLNARFGRIAAGLGERQPETDFQIGLRRFSFLLLRVALTLTVLILVINLLLRRPLIDAVLFSLAIAVGITPQLLPAVVSTSLATGSRRLAASQVLVKRLVCIEDLGDIDVLMTDKTGTLTEGRVTLIEAIDPAGRPSEAVLRAGLLTTDIDPAIGGTSVNPLDAALWESPAGQRISLAGAHRIAALPFDHDRRASSTVVDMAGGRVGTETLIHKGAPEQVLQRCAAVPEEAGCTLDRLFAEGRRVVAVASRRAAGLTALTAADETGLTLQGFLVFADPPKQAARTSLAQLTELGIDVKVATGDNPAVAERVCAELGLISKGTFTGGQLDGLDEAAFEVAAQTGTVFARISPEQKARLVRALRRTGRSIGFLGDGVNDALALHSADVGISVD
ncbi:MAG: HAD-IC family P-type ATPase, partial [Mycobacterium sp.]|nr:HAD-IC family P-type ATPase [Mycobacterium sp.]